MLQEGQEQQQLSTGSQRSWKGAGKAAFKGAVDGASDGFMWGGLSAGAAFTTVAAKGAQVQKVGFLKDSRSDKKPYFGVRYARKSIENKNIQFSMQFHLPHNNAHNFFTGRETLENLEMGLGGCYIKEVL